MKQHGVTALRGIEAAHHEEGRFGRLFPKEKPFSPKDSFLIGLGQSMKDKTLDPAGDSRSIPAGFTFLGQFVAHDITFDTTSALDRKNDPSAIKDFRTPGLDLDCVYGSGPEASPFLYDKVEKHKMLLGSESNPYDVPRNRQGVALIGDPRNDVSLVTSQLQNLFLRFHNRVVDQLRDEGEAEREIFEKAQHLTRWHYQWILTHDFLPRVAGQKMVNAVRDRGRVIYLFKGNPFIPVEFAVAAYRYGHAQMRSIYKVNDQITKALLFTDLHAFSEVTPDRRVDWRNFFEVDAGHPPQPSRKINSRIADEMHKLPFVPEPDKELHSIAVRNLLRGKALGLPSGQAAARRIGAKPLTADELGFEGDAPLWYYILKEAEVRHDGETLGEVGGRIVCETFLGFLEADPDSYYAADRSWRPTLPSAKPGDFTMADLVRFTES